MEPRGVFVGGLQRSGTTLAARLLATHPEIAGIVGTRSAEDEGQFVQDVYPDDHVMGGEVGRGPGKTMRWAWHPEAHLTEADLDARPEAGRRLLESWRPYFDKPEAPHFVEKSPSDLMRTRFLQAAFPGSAFIVVTRHPVLQALAVRKWGSRATRVGLGMDRVIEHWLVAMECYAADAPHLERAMTWRFEDLVTRPAEGLTRAGALLGLDPAGFRAEEVEARPDPYLDHWRYFAGIDRSRGFRPVTRGQHRATGLEMPVARLVALALGPSVAARIRRRFEERMRAFGYGMDDLASPA